jgi:hypothetical protein
VYESRTQPLLARTAFARRFAAHVAIAVALLVCSLGIGMLGYMATEHMSAIDAFVNVAMLLGGMGPVSPLQTAAGKLFAGLFALYAGLVFIICAAVVLTPVLHRLLHHFHVSDRP